MASLQSSDLVPLAIISGIVLAAFIVFWQVADMIVLGGSLAIVLLPLHRRISARYGWPFLSAILLTGCILALFTGLGLLTVRLILDNTDALTSMFTAIETWLSNPSSSPLSYGIPFGKATLANLVSRADAFLLNYETTVRNDLAMYLFRAFVFFFSLGALIYHGDQLKTGFVARMPPAVSDWMGKLSSVTVDTLYAIYVVQVAIAVLTFFIAIPVFWLLGYDHIVFYSFLTAFCELIPVLGASAMFLFVGAYSLALGDTRGIFIVFFLGYIVVACLPEIYVRPVLVGRRVNINPIIMFIGIIGGILTMGLAGFVLGPVLIVLLTTSYRLYSAEKKRKRSDTPDSRQAGQ